MAPEQKKILIVDDEEIIVDILKRRFERMGFCVDTACDGACAIAIIKAHAVDLVICDIRMPNGTDGEDVLRAAREFVPGARFVAMSGHIMTDESVQRIMNSGVSLFLKKPFPSLGEATQQMANLIDSPA